MRRFSLLVFVLLLSLSLNGFSANKKTIEQKLQTIDKTIMKKKSDYNKLRQQYAKLLNDVKSTDALITSLKTKIKKAKRDLNLLNRKIANLKKEIGKVSKNVEEQKEELSLELKGYYKYSRISPYYEQGVWFDYMNRFITSYMQNRIRDYLNKSAYLRSSLLRLNAYMKKKNALLDNIKKQQEDLQTQRETLKKLMDEADSKKQQYLAQIQKLTQEKENLRNLLKKIIEEEKRRQAEQRKRKAQKAQKINPKLVVKEFKALRGRVALPVSGRVVSTFGKKYDPLFKVYTRNDGIDIKSKKDSCVRSIAYGKVGFAGNLPGYGGVVIINHLNGYYTVYGGIKSKVGVGSIVKSRQCIGKLEKNKLHFEIRRHSTPLNPLNFLDRRFLK
ncbi:murein hydrolase activator EnvC family protein [Hippea maritima]|uniref:Peptidase M23 n=1 Tax=Hippea maritima (strain ATCC 700847 / DSM 10411 / MH2) TaxID=760142 RepID=F2LWF2_HIPMA|nr:peptidoglycan DD-metalloendopeptidase family protein [Hippea maritima]AEA32998.1 Peptidase M23 [Hippea maritima DSM 10411]